MEKKYQITSQLTGLPTEVLTYEDAMVLREQYIKEFIEHAGLFPITLLVKNIDGHWVQQRCDSNGEPNAF